MLAATATPVSAQAPQDDATTEAVKVYGVAEYQHCVDRAAEDPRAALTQALEWEGMGGGGMARHCQAMALVALGRPEAAALRLQTIASQSRDKPDLSAMLLTQAGAAWLQADRLQRAEDAFNNALKQDPTHVVARVERAVLRAGRGAYWTAMDDLNVALDHGGVSPRLLTVRAAVWRGLEAPELAEVDIAQALEITPNHPGALLEQGLLAADRGQRNRAREAWLTLIQKHPESDEARVAQGHLQRMDVVIRAPETETADNDGEQP